VLLLKYKRHRRAVCRMTNRANKLAPMLGRDITTVQVRQIAMASIQRGDPAKDHMSELIISDIISQETQSLADAGDKDTFDWPEDN